MLYLALDRKVELCISDAILAETLRVLGEKFQLAPYDLYQARLRLLFIVSMIVPQVTLNIVADEPDNRILECAAESGSVFVVTEDQALLRLKSYGKTRIINAAEMLDILQGRAAEG